MSRTHTPVPNDKLSHWHFAVGHAIHCIEMRIKASSELGFSSQYDEHQLNALRDLDMFLNMSWGMYMNDLEHGCKSVIQTLTDLCVEDGDNG